MIRSVQQDRTAHLHLFLSIYEIRSTGSASTFPALLRPILQSMLHSDSVARRNRPLRGTQVSRQVGMALCLLSSFFKKTSPTSSPYENDDIACQNYLVLSRPSPSTRLPNLSHLVNKLPASTFTTSPTPPNTSNVLTTHMLSSQLAPYLRVLLKLPRSGTHTFYREKLSC